MKSLIRSLVVNAISLYTISLIIPGVTFQNGLRGLGLTIIILVLINRLVRPLVSLLLLPINLITLGAFRWLINVIVIYLLSLLSSNFTITGFNLNQIPLDAFSTTQLHLGIFWAAVLTAFLFNLLQSTLRWFLR